MGPGGGPGGGAPGAGASWPGDVDAGAVATPDAAELVPPPEDAGQADPPDAVLDDASTPAPFVLSSAAFGAGERLPNTHSCVGGSVSPPLSWSEGPAGTQSYAVALIARYQTFQGEQQTAQWLLWDIHAQALPAGVAAGEMPANVAGAHQANNNTSSTLPILGTPPSYVAPCVLTGIDSFEFVVYALSVDALGVSTPANPDTIVSQLESAAGLVLARSTLPFTFP